MALIVDANYGFQFSQEPVVVFISRQCVRGDNHIDGLAAIQDLVLDPGPLALASVVGHYVELWTEDRELTKPVLKGRSRHNNEMRPFHPFFQQVRKERYDLASLAQSHVVGKDTGQFSII